MTNKTKKLLIEYFVINETRNAINNAEIKCNDYQLIVIKVNQLRHNLINTSNRIREDATMKKFLDEGKKYIQDAFNDREKK